MDLATLLSEHKQSMPWLASRVIFATKHGSHAYGTSTPTSDLDVKGVAIPPATYFLGFSQKFEQAEAKNPADSVIYGIRKFFALAADCNPSIIEVLFTDRSDWIHATTQGVLMVKSAHLFLSRKARHTFSGYAMSQLKRIQRHNRWLRSPPTHKPTRAEYNLPERTVLPADQLGRLEAAVKTELDSWNIDYGDLSADQVIHIENQLDRLVTIYIGQDEKFGVAAVRIGLDENIVAILEAERKYKNALNEWQHYQTWLAQRNPARAELERKFGYDTKHGMHLVRLMRMCHEILTTGKVIVKRPDAEELLAIRNGAWTYDQLLGWAEQQDQAMDQAYAASPLPARPPRDLLDALCEQLVESML